MSEIDWEELFWKYVNRVGIEEGVDFLSSQYNRDGSKWCNDEEWEVIINNRYTH